MFTIVFQSKEKMPMYEQLYRHVRQEIEQNRLRAGEKLPSKRKLAAHLKISLITVETAYEQLLAEGYVRSVPKSGYFVEPLRTQNLQVPQARNPMEQPAKPQTSSYTYDFRTNGVETEDFPFATWARLSRKILSEQKYALLTHTEPQGLYGLRQEIADYLYTCRGVQADPEQIVVGAGSEYLLTLLVALLGREKTYGVENPGYHKISKIFQSNGSCVKPIPLDEQGLQVTELEQSGADVVLVTPSHHFPLGVVMPMQRRLELIAWAKEKEGRYIIEDDYDSEFRFSGKPIQTLQRLTPSQQVIYMNTFAKSLAPSLRIGYMVLPKPLLQRFQQELSFYSCTVPSFEQYTLAEFMKHGYYERHVARMRNLYKERRNVLVEALAQTTFGNKCHLQGQKAGLHLLLQVKNGMTEQQLVEAARQVGVRVYGLSDYYEKEKAPLSTVVLGFAGMKNEEIKEAVARLEKVW